MQITSLTIGSTSYSSKPNVMRGKTYTVNATIYREVGDNGIGVKIVGGEGSRYNVYVNYDFTIDEGDTKTISFSWTVPSDNAWLNNNLAGNDSFVDPSWKITVGVVQGNGRYSNTKTVELTTPCTYIRCNPQILEFDMVRATNGSPDDEGESVLTTLRLSSNLSAGTSGATLMLYYAVDSRATTSSLSYIDLSSYISDAIATGFTNSQIISTTFANEYDYGLLLVFTAADGESVVLETELSQSFANVHLSGKSTGGICFGGFCSSEDDFPKFESYYPAYLYGGIAEVGALKNSLMALGIQYGQTSSVDANKTTFTVTFDRPYSMPPYVYAMPVSVETASTDDIDRIQVAVKTVTNSQAKISAYNDAGTRTFCINWLAIGAPNNDPDAASIVTMPPAAMTSSTANGCAVSASSTYSSSYSARKAFDFNTSTSWASSKSDSAPWIQINMSTALKNIKVSVYARGNTSAIHNPTAGNVQLSNTGSSWTTAATYSDWNDSAYEELLGTIECNNTTAYSYVRLNITSKSGNEGYAAIGYISIEGEK